MNKTAPASDPDRDLFLAVAQTMYDELSRWREQNPEASFDEIAAQVTPRRRELMGILMAHLARQHDFNDDEAVCTSCGTKMERRGVRLRALVHLEGDVKLGRAYYYCRFCGSGTYLLDQRLNVTEHCWSPATIDLAIRIGSEIPSYRRAASCFRDLTHVSVSKSSLQRLVRKFRK